MATTASGQPWSHLHEANPATVQRDRPRGKNHTRQRKQTADSSPNYFVVQHCFLRWSLATGRKSPHLSSKPPFLPLSITRDQGESELPDLQHPLSWPAAIARQTTAGKVAKVRKCVASWSRMQSGGAKILERRPGSEEGA